MVFFCICYCSLYVIQRFVDNILYLFIWFQLSVYTFYINRNKQKKRTQPTITKHKGTLHSNYNEDNQNGNIKVFFMDKLLVKGFNTMNVLLYDVHNTDPHSLCTNIPVSNTTTTTKLKRYCVFNLKFCTFVITFFILLFFYIIIIHFLLFIRDWPTFPPLVTTTTITNLRSLSLSLCTVSDFWR